jgi:hypothetical protein
MTDAIAQVIVHCASIEARERAKDRVVHHYAMHFWVCIGLLKF